MTKVLIYGGTGYTGRLAARETIRQNLDIMVAARSSKIEEVASDLGCDFRVFGLEHRERILASLRGIDLLVNLAGPFSVTQRPLLEACIEARCSYLDIAGEVDEMKSAHEYDLHAQRAKVLLLPGAGFGVVPTDIAALMARDRLPDTNLLQIAYATEGGVSRGTLKTVFEMIQQMGYKRVDHQIIPASPAESSLEFELERRRFEAVYNPWRADLFTAGLSTGIANIETYSVFPGLVVQMMKGKWPRLRRFLLNHLIRWLPEGPSDRQLRKGATYILARAQNGEGEVKNVEILGPEAYVFTVRCLAAIAKRVRDSETPVGFQTPAIFGRDLLESVEGVEIRGPEN